ncbi:MAG: hypothetical protein ACAH80_16810, partial [Alphaproteobacteria bacterium]
VHRVSRQALMKNKAILLAVLLCLCLPRPSVGQQSVSPDTKISPLDSILYQDCRDGLKKEKFENTYCAAVLRSAFYSSSMALWAIFHNSMPCAPEMKAALADISMMGRLAGVSIKDVAAKYVEFVEKENLSLPGLENILLDDDELMMASSIISNFPRSKTIFGPFPELSKDGPWIKGPKWHDTYALYSSCKAQDFKKPNNRSFCKAVISGAWIGYAVELHEPPKYSSNEKCADERNEIVGGILKRLNRELACFRIPVEETARAFVERTDSLKPADAILLQREGPYFAAMAEISRGCLDARNAK